MNRKITLALTTAFAASALLLAACQPAKSPVVKEPVVQVGKVTLGQSDLNAFIAIARSYPAPLPHYFPERRMPVTFMAECEAIYQQAPAKAAAAIKEITASHDWTWKKKYFTSSLFIDLLRDNLGFTDAELEAHYKKSPDEYRAQVRTDAGEDSTFIQEFDAVRRQVADNLFYEKHKPDSAFIAKLNSAGHDHDHDSAMIRNHWLYNVRSNPMDFFMRLFFYERNGVAYDDSVEQMLGEGKTLAEEDLEVVRSWVPPDNRRSMREKELVEWLYKWKIFAEHAEKIGLTAKPEYKEHMHWALRVEYAITYLRDEVLPQLTPQTSPFDPAIAELALFDQMRRVDEIDQARLQAELGNIARLRLNVMVDSVIYDIRKAVGITFLQDELKDERSADPAVLIAQADSLKEAAADNDGDNSNVILDEAEKLYRALVTDFAFTAEGRRATGELAKLLVDKYTAGSHHDRHLLSQAVFFYRRGQVFETDTETLCNSTFMAGFIYDEHLKAYSLAEANYKWVLRHTPGCALASDAEFMLLHLDEPMTSIEEIQGQSLRQGRPVEFEDEDSAGDVDVI